MFIVVEGPDGVGKGTQVAMLIAWLVRLGFDVWETREPTDGLYGRRIRKILDKQEPMPEATNFQMLYTEDRVQHVLEILEHLRLGQTVVCDRYFYSTFAYGGASGADVERLRQANSEFPTPRMMLWLNLDSQSARARMEERGILDEHDKDLSFQDRLQQEYCRIVDEFPEAIEIDAAGSPEEVHQRIVAVVERQLKTR